MANVAAPYGFRPVQERNGSPWSGKTRRVIFASTDAATCFVGDLVKYTGTQILDTESGVYLPVVTKAAAADVRLAGAVTAFEYDTGENGWISYKKANTQIIANIPADATVLYSAQEDGDTSFLASTDVEANVDFVVGSGNTATGMSTSAIDSDSAGTTDTIPLRLVGTEQIPGGDNEVGSSNYVQWLVTINQDAYTDKTGL